jgi:hypothetical protein
VNTGSVGRPKDHDPWARYVLLDFSASTPSIEFVRVTYDVESAVTALGAAGLPEAFGEFLRAGGQPALRQYASHVSVGPRRLLKCSSPRACTNICVALRHPRWCRMACRLAWRGRSIDRPLRVRRFQTERKHDNRATRAYCKPLH